MRHLKHNLKHLLIEPYKWVFFYFFQPDQFMRKVEELKATSHYRSFLFGLSLPVFLIPYILSIALVVPYNLSYPPNLFLISAQVALGTLLGVIIGVVWDMLSGIPVYVGG